MLSSGNGTPQVCVFNLMCLMQGEVPYDRLRGMNPDMIDKNTPQFFAEAVNHAAWLIETYEPGFHYQMQILLLIKKMM